MADRGDASPFLTEAELGAALDGNAEPAAAAASAERVEPVEAPTHQRNGHVHEPLRGGSSDRDTPVSVQIWSDRDRYAETLLGEIMLCKEPEDVAHLRWIFEHLVPGDFQGAQAEIFSAERRLWERSKPIDVVELLAELRATTGSDWSSPVNRVMQNALHTADVLFHAQRVLELTLDRDESMWARVLAESRTTDERARCRQRLEHVASRRAASEASPAEALSWFRPVQATELLAKELPPLDWVVQPVLHRGGVTMLVASYKRGKSLLALSLGVDLALVSSAPHMHFDKTWLGLPVAWGGPTLLLSAEGGERLVQMRLDKMAGRDRGDLGPLHVWADLPTPQLDREDHLDLVFGYAEQQHCILVVIDPLGRFWSLEDENDPKLTRDLVLGIQMRAQRAYGGLGIAVLIVHHDTKLGGDPGTRVSGGRGSGKFADDVDALINLKIVGDGEAGESEVHFLTRWEETPKPRRVAIDPETLRLEVVEDERYHAGDGFPERRDPARWNDPWNRRKITPSAALEAARAIPATEKDADGWFDRRVWEKALGVSEKTLRRAVQEGLLADLEGVLEHRRAGGAKPAMYRLILLPRSGP